MSTVTQLAEAHRDQLRLLSARIGFKPVATETVVEIADELLKAGVYDDSLLAVVDAQPKTQEEVIPPFRDFLLRAGIAVPDRDRALWILLAHYIRRIATSANDPFTPLNELINDLYWDYGFDQQPGSYLGESHGIHHLIGHYWLYDYMLDEPQAATYNGKSGTEAIDELKRVISGDAQLWLRNYEQANA